VPRRSRVNATTTVNRERGRHAPPLDTWVDTGKVQSLGGAGGRPYAYGDVPMGVRVLFVDNYDSFTFNLVQYVRELGATAEVFKNDAIDVAGIRARALDGLAHGGFGVLVSPGPCTPNEAGVSLPLIGALAGEVPIFGVCLGHQAIGQAFGGRVVRADRLMHGKTSPILHDGRGLFEGLPSPFDATRYHSLILERSTLPECLEVSAWTEDGELMGLRHRAFDVEGVQFHPESVLTVEGKRLVGNWVRRLGEGGRRAA
jgi:anthranilate synthase/aminodeoxychorismate synthase-like glutamine amidotransferase